MKILKKRKRLGRGPEAAEAPIGGCMEGNFKSLSPLVAPKSIFNIFWKITK